MTAEDSKPERHAHAGSDSVEPIHFPFPEPTKLKTVWHHTSAQGLLSILETGQFWLSNPQALNDSTEFLYLYREIKHLWADPHTKIGVSQVDAQFVDEVLNDELFADQRDSTFILSATSKFDSLNQWMHYGKSDGFALGLDTQYLFCPKDSPSLGASRQSGDQLFFSYWYDVVYETTEREKLTREVLDFVINVAPRLFNRTSKESSTYMARWIISNQAVRIKHEGFMDEREVRFVTGRAPETPLHFRSLRGNISPYIEAVPISGEVSSGIAVASHLPIKEIVAGPNTDKGELKWLKRLMELHGYPEVEIKYSKVPYKS